MQDIRDLLQQAATHLAVLTQAQARTQQQLDQTQAIVDQTQAIATSNARSIQAWEALISQNRDEAEEERSRLAVRLTDLEQASRENIQQHFAFMQRFDETLAEIRRIWQRLES